MVRMQADFHSALLMCVSRSQNPMQSASDLPPPPGALGADSLGLAEKEVPGDSARFGRTTPPDEICVGSCGGSGATGAGSDIGSAIADGGITLSGGAGSGAIVTSELAAELAADVLPLVAVAPAGPCIGRGPPTTAGVVRAGAAGERLTSTGSD